MQAYLQRFILIKYKKKTNIYSCLLFKNFESDLLLVSKCKNITINVYWLQASEPELSIVDQY